MKFILTRYLYAKDEVVISFITSLLEKRNLDECLFWIYEYHYSGFDAFELLWKVYLDFYGALNPKLNAYLRRKYLDDQENNISSIGNIVRNMYGKQIDSTVFILRQYMKTDLAPTRIYLGRAPKWLSKYDAKFKLLLRSIQKRHYENICYYLKKLLNNCILSLPVGVLAREVYMTLVAYFRDDENIDIMDEDECQKKWKERMVYDDAHTLIAMIVHMLQKEEDITVRKKPWITIGKENLDKVEESETELPLTEFGLPQIYNTLSFKRLYGIDESIGSFHLDRDLFKDYKEFVNANWLNWEYYASGSPLWKERVERFAGIIDDKNATIKFENDDDLEQFYEHYGYELDEQVGRIQSMSLKQIETKSWKGWYDKIFQNESIVDFDEDFRFIY